MTHTIAPSVAAFALVAAMPAAAQDIAYQAYGYTVYREQPGYCTLYLNAPGGAMVRMSYRADGTTNFSYVKAGLVNIDPSVTNYPTLFQFDGSRDLAGYLGTDMKLDDGRAGFMLANAGPELLDQWANARSVTIRLVSVSAEPLDTIALKGSAPAIATLRRCVKLGYADVITPTVMPTPPAQDSAPAMARRFPNGERVSLAFEPAGVGGTGTITHRAPGQPATSVTISYMSEFGAIVAANRVRYSVTGTTAQGERSWSCEVTIDWRTAKIVTVRDLSRFPHPPCKESL